MKQDIAPPAGLGGFLYISRIKKKYFFNPVLKNNLVKKITEENVLKSTALIVFYTSATC